jgi:predicted kinase
MIVILNGPPGVGKTTVAKMLKQRLLGTVCIHGDELRAFAPEVPRKHLGGGSTYRAAAVLACSYLQMGAPRVLFDYCFLRPSHLHHFTQAMPDEASLHLFTLWAPLKLVQHRERTRDGRQPLGDAVEECYQEMQGHLPRLGTVVDATAADAQSLAESIDAQLPAG